MNKKTLPPPEDWPKTHPWPLKKNVKIVAIKEMYPPIYVLNTGEWVYGVLAAKKSKKKSAVKKSAVKKRVKKSKSKGKKRSQKIQDDDGEMFKRKRKHFKRYFGSGTWNKE